MATEDHKQHLAGLKHGEDAVRVDQTQWPGLLFEGDEYIEAIFTCGLSIEGLEAVRMPRKKFDEFFDDLFDFLAAGPADYAGSEFQEFRDILEALEKHSVRLDLIDA